MSISVYFLGVTMIGVWLKKLGVARGRARLWIETQKLFEVGLSPGIKFSISNTETGICLKPDPMGKNTVSTKMKSGKAIPVIDINSDASLSALKGCEVVRLVIRKEAVFVLKPASEIARQDRLNRIKAKIVSGQPLDTASLAHGGGILTHAAHSGLKEAGIDCKTRLIVEIDAGYVEHSLSCNGAVDKDTQVACLPMQELVQDAWAMSKLPTVDVFEFGLPCSGASKAGKTKGRLEMMESHVDVGHLVYAAIALIQRLGPAVVVLENVTQYAETASAQILKNQLRDMGYNTREFVLDSTEFGCMEKRIRWALVATTVGMEELISIERPAFTPKKLGDILESISPDDECWSELQYLKDKEVRDKKDGKGFSMQLVTPESTSVTVIRKQYAKRGSTDPYLVHPTNPNLLRLLTPTEHSRVKGVPEGLIRRLCATVAHQILGQGIAYEPFKALFRDLGHTINTLKLGAQTAVQSCHLAPRMASVTG